MAEAGDGSGAPQPDRSRQTRRKKATRFKRKQSPRRTAQQPTGRRRGGARRPKASPRSAPPAAPARRAAFSVLLQLETGEGDRPDSLLAQHEGAETRAPDDRDRALARELVFGVLRWQRLLDHALDGYTRRSVGRLDAPVRIALRLGLYQLRFLDRVPARAAVHESVSLAIGAANSGAGGMVNAVLRSYLRADHPWPHRSGDPELYLRTGLSHPDWMVDRLVDTLGANGARARMEANNRNPVVFLRVGRRLELTEAQRRLREDGVECERFPLAPRCLRVVSGNPQASPLHESGDIHIQDAGSQLVAWLLPLDGARNCLDACAAPGGKATILAERTAPRRVIAADARPARVELLVRTANTLTTPNLLPLAGDATTPPFAPRTFDRILLDVPCSGLGTLSRNPDIKWAASPERLNTLGNTAVNIARAGAQLLAPDGMLLYAACSLEPEETTDAVKTLLDETNELRQLSLEDRVPDRLRPLVGEDGALRLPPEEASTDGYYATLLTKPHA